MVENILHADTFFVHALTWDFLPTIKLFDFFFFLLDIMSELSNFAVFVGFKIEAKLLAESQLKEIIVEGFLAYSNFWRCILKTPFL